MATIDVHISDEDAFAELIYKEPVKAIDLLKEEFKQFGKWMTDQGMEPLGRVELQILREYLGYKLTRK